MGRISFFAGALVAALLVIHVLAPDPAPSRSPREPVVGVSDPVDLPVAAEPSPAIPEEPGPEPPEEVAPEIVEVELREDVLPEGELPESALGSGECSLHLTILSRDGGDPVATGIRLWRLGVPEDETWTAGDHVQRTVTIPVEGILLEGLPEGRYRAQCDEQRAGEEDPPVFLVTGAETVRSLVIGLPREFTVRLRVYDEKGDPIERGTLEDRIRSSYGSGPYTPGWARTRSRKDGNSCMVITAGVG